jgi:DNA-binding transcriptional LysR family regulator
LPERLAAFHRTYPDITVQLSIGNTAQVARAVREGAAELGFIEGRIEDQILTQHVVARDHLVLLVRADHRWARLPKLRPEQLPEAAWVLREVGSGTRSEFGAALASHGMSFDQLQIALELPSNEAVRAAVEANAGAAVLSELVARHGLRSGMLARVEFHLPDRLFYALFHSERRHSRAADAFMAMLARSP